MSIGPVRAGPRGLARVGPVAATAAALLACVSSEPAFAQAANNGIPGVGVAGEMVGDTRVLEAADHAELAADISASGVSRIALLGDRVARVIRAPGGPRVEHDPANGDLYLHPPIDDPDRSGREAGFEAGPAAAPETQFWARPSVLFIGTERGFTYRLALTPVPAGATQILIRNPAVMASTTSPDGTVDGRDGRIGALVALIRAVARREPLAGHAIHAGGAVAGSGHSGLTVIETWRGPRFTALVLEAGPSAPGGAEDAADLAGTIGAPPGAGPLAALWLAAPGTGPSGGRLAVAVRESAAGGSR